MDPYFHGSNVERLSFSTGVTDCIICSSLILPILAHLAVSTGRVVVDAGDPSVTQYWESKKKLGQ